MDSSALSLIETPYFASRCLASICVRSLHLDSEAGRFNSEGKSRLSWSSCAAKTSPVVPLKCGKFPESMGEYLHTTPIKRNNGRGMRLALSPVLRTAN